MKWLWSKVANAPSNAQAKAEHDGSAKVNDEGQGVGTALASLHDASTENKVEPEVTPKSTITAVPQSSAQEKNMSFITAVETEIGKVEKTLASWWKNEPAFDNVLASGISIAGMSLETVFTFEGNGAAATLVGNVVSKAQQELLAVNSVVQTIGPNPSAKSVLAGVATDISQLDAAAGIKDPKSIAAVNLALQTINNLVASFPDTPTTPATPAA